MFGNSSQVQSSQTQRHPKLERVLESHFRSEYLAPTKERSREALARAQEFLRDSPGEYILDSGCGTGESTAQLAAEYPDRRIIGFDKSAVRTAKARRYQQTANALILRAEAVDFWRLLREAGLKPRRHFILYPNPWPKPSQFKRRWHAHPVFPSLLALGGELLVRSNWRLYLEEFAFAVERCRSCTGEIKRISPQVPISAFERKYQESGHSLFEYRVLL